MGWALWGGRCGVGAVGWALWGGRCGVGAVGWALWGGALWVGYWGDGVGGLSARTVRATVKALLAAGTPQ